MVSKNLSYSGNWAHWLLTLSFFISAAGVTGYNDTLHTALQEPTKTELVFAQKTESTKSISSLTTVSTINHSNITPLFLRFERIDALRIYHGKSMVAQRIAQDLFLSYSWALSKRTLIFLLLRTSSGDHILSLLG